jgi:signal transduction histidine kinase
MSDTPSSPPDHHAQQERERRAVVQACHDLRNLLAVARGHLELVRMRSTDEQIVTDTDLVITQLDRMVTIASELRATCAADAGRAEPHHGTSGAERG